jgi:hypothetical protein
MMVPGFTKVREPRYEVFGMLSAQVLQHGGTRSGSEGDKVANPKTCKVKLSETL